MTYRVTLYDKLDAQMAQFDIPGNTDDEIFAGFLTTDPGITIGRIDIFSLQGFFDGIAAVWAYTQPDPPLCDLPFACGGSSQQCIVGTACICLETPDGDYFCGNVQQPQCNSIGLCPGGDADCPPGSRCADFTCCGEPICLSECLTSPLPAKGPRAGPSEVPESPILGTAPR